MMRLVEGFAGFQSLGSMTSGSVVPFTTVTEVQVTVFILPEHRGTEMPFPGPLASHDLWEAADSPQLDSE
jgi:hypothetical protein